MSSNSNKQQVPSVLSEGAVVWSTSLNEQRCDEQRRDNDADRRVSSRTEDTSISFIAQEAVVGLPIVEDAHSDIKGISETTTTTTEDGTSTLGDDTNTLHVVLYRNRDYNAVIEYNKNIIVNNRNTTSRNSVYVLITNLPPSSSFEELSFPVCYESDRLLSFTRAHIDEDAIFARMYTKEAWALLFQIAQKFSLNQAEFLVYGIVFVWMGLVQILLPVVNKMAAFCDDKDAHHFCSWQNHGDSLILVSVMLILGILLILTPGLQKRLELGKITSGAVDKTNKYSFEVSDYVPTQSTGTQDVQHENVQNIIC